MTIKDILLESADILLPMKDILLTWSDTALTPADILLEPADMLLAATDSALGVDGAGLIGSQLDGLEDAWQLAFALHNLKGGGVGGFIPEHVGDVAEVAVLAR